MIVRALWVSVVLLSFGGVSAAQDESDAEAQARFTAGEIAFGAGRFEDALSDFRRAYELSERPELLYNIGLAAYRLRDDVQALEAFERFIEALPGHPNAAQVRGRIETIRRDQASAARETENREAYEAEGDPGNEVSPPAEQSRVGPWVLGVAGGALAIGGAVLLALALSDRSEIESMTTPVPWPQIEDQVDSVPRRSGAGIALLAVGGAAAVSAVLWRVMTPNEDVSVSVGAGTVSVAGSF